MYINWNHDNLVVFRTDCNIYIRWIKTKILFAMKYLQCNTWSIHKC